nr:hypothetical protein Iba_chr14bCG11460 [Ipomoea batatas]
MLETRYPRKCVDARSFMLSRQPSLISFSISADVIPVAKREIQNCFLDNFKAPFLSHTLGYRTRVLCYLKDVSSTPDMISSLNPDARAYLEFPLCQRANTLNLAELFTASLLFGFITTEPHIFEAMGEASVELLAILICHWAEGAKICAIFTYSLLKILEIASIRYLIIQ